MVRSNQLATLSLPLRAIAFGALALVAASPSARAASPQSDPSAVTRDVNIASLDLTTPAGQQTLRHRIALAARQVCEQTTGNAQIDSNIFVDCYVAAARDGWRVAEVQIAAAEEHTRLASAK